MLQAQNIVKTCPKGLVALGSNIPIRGKGVLETINVALKLLSESESIEVVKTSRLYRTPAFPAGAGADFVNAAVVVRSSLSAVSLLGALHEIENEMGRSRHQRWEARIIDLDLIACGDLVVPDQKTLTTWMDIDLQSQMRQTPQQLILPHPRMHQRGFVLVPLQDVAPDWEHPVLGQTVRDMVQNLPADELAKIIPVEAGDTGSG